MKLEISKLKLDLNKYRGFYSYDIQNNFKTGFTLNRSNSHFVTGIFECIYEEDEVIIIKNYLL